MMRWALALGAALMLMAAPDAQACLVASSQVGVLSPSEPIAPEDALILEVEIARHDSLTAGRAYAYARVHRVVRGDFEHDTVRMFLWMSSCHVPPAIGQRGYVAGSVSTDHFGNRSLIPIWRSPDERAAER